MLVGRPTRVDLGDSVNRNFFESVGHGGVPHLDFNFHVDQLPKVQAPHPVEGRVVDADGVVPKQPVLWSKAKSLAAMQERFAFFSPAVLYLYGRLEDQMLADFGARRPDLEVWYGYTLFDRQIFRGLTHPDGDARWNHALWCMPKATYPAFRAHIASIVVNDSRLKWRALYDAVQVDLAIPDPIYPLGSMEIDVFGVKASTGTFFMQQSPVPRLRRGPVHADLGVYMKALLDGDNPLQEVEYQRELREQEDDP